MAKRCELTGTGVMTGNNVSHSNRKTRRRFMPNIQKVSMLSDALKRAIPMKLTAATIRTVEHNGGLDNFLVTTADSKLTEEAKRLKRQVKKAMAKSSAA